MILTLTRPLVALDVETHDKVEPEKARIVELGFKVIYHDEREPKRWVSYIKPDMVISEGAIEVHGITNEFVMGCSLCGIAIDNHPILDDHTFEPWPTFKSLAHNLAYGFTGCDFCGYHVRYDIRVIAAEMQRAGVEWSQGDARLLDGMHLWRIVQPRTLGDAVRAFLGREPTEAHRALGDAEDALDVALAMIERYPDRLPPDLQKLYELCFDTNNIDPDGKFIWVDGEAAFSFGKWKNTKLHHVPKDYLQWMVDKGDFSIDVKRIVWNALNGVYPVKQVPLEESPF